MSVAHRLSLIKSAASVALVAALTVPATLNCAPEESGPVVLMLSGCPEDARPGDSFELSATVTDSAGATVAGAAVTFEVTSGPGDLDIDTDGATVVVTIPDESETGRYLVTAAVEHEGASDAAECSFEVVKMVEPCGCRTDGDCNDGDACTGAETCDGCRCRPGTPPECDDGLNCTADICDPVKACEHLNTCPDDRPTCVDDGRGGTCASCLTDADCDDGLSCTTDVCDLAKGCQSISICPSDRPRCIDDGAAEVCAACVEDAHCDDGMFCNGAETCVDQICADGDPPCNPDTQTCDESIRVCNCVGGCLGTFVLTTAEDFFLGGDLVDTFSGVVQAGESTLSPGDNLDGRASADIMNVVMVDADYEVGATIIGIERFFVFVADDTSHRFDVAGISDVQELWTDGSLAALEFTGIDHLVVLGVEGTDQDLTATFDNAVLAGTHDTIEVLLNAADGGDLVIASDGFAGVERVEIRTLADHASTLGSILDGGENDLRVLTFLNAGPVEVEDIDPGVEVIDGTQALASLELWLPDNENLAVLGGESDDVLDASRRRQPVSIDAGPGDDDITGGDGDDSLDGGAGGDSRDGGGGSDTYVYDADHEATIDADTLAFAAGAGGDVLRIAASEVCNRTAPQLSGENFVKGSPAVAADNSVLILTDQAYASFSEVEAALDATGTGTSDYLVCFVVTGGSAQCWIDDDSATSGGCHLATLSTIAATAELDLLVQANFQTK